MEVPFIDLKRLVAKYRSEIDQAMAQAMDQTAFVGGRPVIDFEKKLCEQLDVMHGIGVSNGTDALVVALQAMGLKPGMKVAVPNLTFWATVEAVVVLGATPVFIDCDESLQMSFSQFSKMYREEGFDMAIIAHLYGWASPDLRELRQFCRSHDIPLLEDAAQAYGVRFQDTGEGLLKDAEIATLSFYPAKVIGACGDAGAIVCRDEGLAKLCRTLINHGRAEHYSYSHVGWNARMSGLAAAFLNVMMDHDDEILNSRREAETYYLENLQANPSFDLISPPSLYKTNGYLNVCLVKPGHVDRWTSFLKEKGIGFGRTYPEPMHIQPAVRELGIYSDLTRSIAVCEHVVNLPLYTFMRREELEYVVNQNTQFK